MHVDQEEADALMLGQIEVRARHQNAEIRVMSAGVPDLLAVDDPPAVFQLCLGGEPRQIGAAAGLAEQLAPGVLTSEDRPQVAALLIVVTHGEDRLRGQPPRPGLGDRDDAPLAKHPGNHRCLLLIEIPTIEIARPVRRRPAAIDQEGSPLGERQLRIPMVVQPGVDLLLDALRSR